jgi:plasmid stability protein
MAELILREIEDEVVRKLEERAGQHGVSMEEEARRILRKNLLTEQKEKMSFHDFLLTMPNVGEDEDFERVKDYGRDVEL